jgi:isochorismate hydrolase
MTILVNSRLDPSCCFDPLCAKAALANTDLDAKFTQRGIEKIILVGFVANICIESATRFGMKLGYHVTLINDATAAFAAACTRRRRSMECVSGTPFSRPRTAGSTRTLLMAWESHLPYTLIRSNLRSRYNNESR